MPSINSFELGDAINEAAPALLSLANLLMNGANGRVKRMVRVFLSSTNKFNQNCTFRP